jgi:group I intron endonuclease
MTVSHCCKIFSIYKITNSINEKIYVGFTSAKDPRERFLMHSGGHSKCIAICAAFQKYGAENFAFEVIYESRDGRHTLKEMEPYFIAKLEAFGPKGYNLCKGGQGTTGSKRSPEQVEAWRVSIRASGNHVNVRKTHCKHGHEYSTENTSYNKRGVRSCRTCFRLKQRTESIRKLYFGYRRAERERKIAAGIPMKRLSHASQIRYYGEVVEALPRQDALERKRRDYRKYRQRSLATA